MVGMKEFLLDIGIRLLLDMWLGAGFVDIQEILVLVIGRMRSLGSRLNSSMLRSGR